MTEDELQLYVDTFERTGFTGGLNWYRNIDRNWELLADYEGRTIEQPALFMVGSRDSTAQWMPASAMDGHVTDLREVVTVEGAGHWLQQERPGEVNRALLALLQDAGW
jgi:pimeloyl-ACP methyl ester carboxylesterase